MKDNRASAETDELVKLSFFAEVGKRIAQAKSLHQTFEEIMNQIGEIFAPSYWSLLLRNRQTGDLKFVIVTGSGTQSLQGKILPRGVGIAGWIAENGRSVIIDDARRDERFDPRWDRQTDFTTRSIVGVPLKTKGHVFGVIELINTLESRSFTPLDLKLLTTIADFAAIAIEKAYYFNALRRLSSTDHLTGLLNRRSFERFYEREVARAERTGSSLTLLLLDVDGFKAINDRYGHLEGDSVLRTVAKAVNENVRKSDVVARFGGDEFVVLLPETDQAYAERIRRRIRHALAAESRSRPYTIRVSIGVDQTDAKNAQDAFRRVDSAMYAEKRSNSGGLNLDEHGATEMERNLPDMYAEERNAQPDG